MRSLIEKSEGVSFSRKAASWLAPKVRRSVADRIDPRITPCASPAMVSRSTKEMNQQVLAHRIARVAAETEAMLASILDNSATGAEIRRPPLLMEAMRYTVLGGGKRFRPFLTVETARLFGKTGRGPLRAGAALELIHCYSLVHDDLPAMDNDDLRRGKPTVHKAYDEALAILVGDGLLTLAFDVAADRRTAASPTIRIELVRILAQGAGIGGMVGGQMLDLAAEGRYPQARQQGRAQDNIVLIQSMKTGALIAAAALMGATIGGARTNQMQAVQNYAEGLGLAFQIRDDLLDVEGDATAVGKATGKDAAAGKATFVSLRGIEGARAHLSEVTATAKAALRPFGHRAGALTALLDFNMTRRS
jgi:farnesyl diphosphate synthase